MTNERIIELLPPSYEPTRKEKEEVFSMYCSPDELASALVESVTIKEKNVEKHRKERDA